MPSVLIADTPTAVLPGDRRRAFYLVQNLGTEPVALGFDNAVTATAGPHAGVLLQPGETLTVGNLPGLAWEAVYAPLWAVHTDTGQTHELRIQSR